MSTALALMCSPRRDGVTDSIVRLFAEGMEEAGARFQLAPLRDYPIAPCTDCGGCASPPHACVQARLKEDRTEEIFSLMLEASVVLIASPIYFYALPAHFKALIDRTQRFWVAKSHAAQPRSLLPQPPVKPVLVALTAGRPRGKLLFTGSLLTLKYFLAPLNAGIRETRLLRGLETPKTLRERPAVCAALRAWGHDWGRRMVAGKLNGGGQLPPHIHESVSPEKA